MTGEAVPRIRRQPDRTGRLATASQTRRSQRGRRAFADRSCGVDRSEEGTGRWVDRDASVARTTPITLAALKPRSRRPAPGRRNEPGLNPALRRGSEAAAEAEARGCAVARIVAQPQGLGKWEDDARRTQCAWC